MCRDSTPATKVCVAARSEALLVGDCRGEGHVGAVIDSVVLYLVSCVARLGAPVVASSPLTCSRVACRLSDPSSARMTPGGTTPAHLQLGWLAQTAHAAGTSARSGRCGGWRGDVADPTAKRHERRERSACAAATGARRGSRRSSRSSPRGDCSCSPSGGHRADESAKGCLRRALSSGSPAGQQWSGGSLCASSYCSWGSRASWRSRSPRWRGQPRRNTPR